MPPSQEFDIDTLSVAEILFILEGRVCNVAHKYVHFGNNLRAAWEELRKNEGEYETLANLTGFHYDEPDWPKEFYDSMSKYFDFTITKKSEIVTALRKIDIPYESLKKRYKRKSDWDDTFNAFKMALGKYVNSVAYARDIKPW